MTSRDALEILLDAPELPEEKRQALAQDLKAVVARYLPGHPVRLLSGVDERDRRWLRLVI
ncbi:hypothetical protein TJA_15790 [Thermus sp. LT1-2-5]|uniref:hypothetical protein n=1 Tax=Thermus sp. LT1-2-5 TaxID=3026935 RepID=UPI0030E91061